MERVQSNGQWSLFCPNEAPGLADCWGEEFEKLYSQYEKQVYSILTWLYFGFIRCVLWFTEIYLFDHAVSFQGKAKKVVLAQNLWFEILKAQIETGTPYMLFKVISGNKFEFYYVSFFFICAIFTHCFSLFFRILATGKATSRIWEPSNLQTYVRR